jgi:hypothetical protein
VNAIFALAVAVEMLKEKELKLSDGEKLRSAIDIVGDETAVVDKVIVAMLEFAIPATTAIARIFVVPVQLKERGTVYLMLELRPGVGVGPSTE